MPGNFGIRKKKITTATALAGELLLIVQHLMKIAILSTLTTHAVTRALNPLVYLNIQFAQT
jgi:hypothetical protein